MAWNIKGRLMESCSCAIVCPCTLGPAQPDQQWCSATFALQVLEGQSDGVDLAGSRIAIGAELPGDFFGGIDKAKLYLDSGLSDDQRRELEAIFHGDRGGVWGGLRENIRSWLPSAITTVGIKDGDAPRVTVEGAGEIVLQPIKTEDGKQATLNNAPVSAAAFGVQVIELAMATGSRWSDPDLRSWESLGYGGTEDVEWSG